MAHSIYRFRQKVLRTALDLTWPQLGAPYLGLPADAEQAARIISWLNSQEAVAS
ncbi:MULTISPECIES: hypothetical protein [Streptomyces]|uniref:hypothetical protein n=1 Tax=Streptomyces TaxID=1883 RepID=UPI00142E3FEC|nr:MULTISPECIES: hypothetical protein [Streptomyces]